MLEQPWKMLKIEEAMFLLFGQDYRRNNPSEPSCGFRGKGASSGARWNSRKSCVCSAADDAGYEDDYEYEYDEAYVIDENEVPTYAFNEDDAGAPWDTEETYWQDESWDETAYEHYDESQPDEEYEEVFAA